MHMINYSEIARQLGVSRQAVHAWHKRHKKRNLNQAKTEQRYELKRKGPAITSLARLIDCSDVGKRLKRGRLNPNNCAFIAMVCIAFKKAAEADPEIANANPQLWSTLQTHQSSIGERNDFNWSHLNEQAAHEWLVSVFCKNANVSCAKPKHDWIYVVQASSGEVKIGISSNVRKRIESLKTSSPLPLNAVFTAQTNDAKSVEKIVHAKFRQNRVQGEWFKIDSQCAVDAITEAIANQKATPPDYQLS